MRTGAAARDLWGLEEGTRYLNHGGFGATPRPVLRAQWALQRQMESHPTRFFMREAPGLIRAAAAQVAEYTHVSPDQMVFVDNATTGINAVLRSLDLGPGDRIVTLDHLYPAVEHTLRYVCEKTGAQLVKVRVPTPVDSEQLLRGLEIALRGAKIAVLDHITSMTGLVLPIAEMCALAQEHGVLVLVDGAHAPGQVECRPREIGATWYVGNCHKWLCAPKGCALMYVSEHAPRLHPAVISNHYQEGLAAEFDYVGTRDVTPWLAMPAVFNFRTELGGDPAIKKHNRDLALYGRQRLLELGLSPTGPESMVGSLACFTVGEGSLEQAIALNQRMYADHRIEVPFPWWDGRIHVRISAQLYNEEADYDALAAVLPELIHSVK